MKKPVITAVLSAVSALFVLTACDGSNTVEEVTPPYPITVDNVTVNERPKAVASLSPALTRILLDLGYQNRIVGYSSLEEIPDPLPEPEPVSSEEPAWWQFWVEESSAPVSDPAPSDVDHMGTAMEPDFEKVGELKPEIIFTAEPFTKAELDKLDQVGIKTVVMPAVSTVEELKNRYLSIIKIMEGQQAADTEGLALTDSIQGGLDYIQSQVPAEKKSFLYVNTLDPLIATGDTLEGSLLSLLGENLAQQGKDYTLDAEILAGLEPDIILYSAPLTPEGFAESGLFKDKAAVAGGALIEIDGSSLLLQTRGIVDSVRVVAEKLYPDVDFIQMEPPAGDASSDESAAPDVFSQPADPEGVSSGE